MVDPQARIEALERENAALRAENTALREQVAGLARRIEALEERLRTNSGNSSQPPSSDGPGAAPTRPKQVVVPSGKKRGGQKGHKKHQRELVPPEQVDHHHECKPGACSGCGARLSGSDPSPLLHQTLTLPGVKPIVDQYALHALTCGGCGTTTRAELPAGTSAHLLTASVVAVVALLMGAHRMSKRCVQSLLSDLYGLRVSLGAIVDAQTRASEALASAVEAAKQHVQAAPVKHADETGWHCSAKRAWLWLMATTQVAVFQVAADRSSAAARELLGACRGVLVSDRFSGYGWWVLRLRQVCWAHLKRDFVKIAERGGESARIGEDLLGRVKYLFEWWSELKAGMIAWTTFRARVRPLKAEVRDILERGRNAEHSKTAKTCTKMLETFDALWYFTTAAGERLGVEPTNNHAERLVRHAVVWRKVCHGTQSLAGALFVGRVLSVQATLRLQQRSVYRFLRDACDAKLRGTEPPSLLPASPAA